MADPHSALFAFQRSASLHRVLGGGRRFMFRGRRCRDDRFAIRLAALLVAAGCTATTTGDPVTIPVQHIEFSREPSKPLLATLELPAGAGPFPAVIVLHGCNGIGIGSRTWAQRLHQWGYAVLLLDSF